MTDLNDLEEKVGSLIEKFNNLSGLKRSNSLLILGRKFKSFEDRCIELAEERFVQAFNPRTEKWVKINKDTGNIVAHKKTKGEYKRIPKADYNSDINNRT